MCATHSAGSSPVFSSVTNSISGSPYYGGSTYFLFFLLNNVFNDV